jgi:hypothetical protein
VPAKTAHVLALSPEEENLPPNPFKPEVRGSMPRSSDVSLTFFIDRPATAAYTMKLV